MSRLRLFLPILLFWLLSGGGTWAGDAARGAQVFETCSTCHTLEAAGMAMQGPSLRGVFGRRAGTLPGFEFSPQMIAAGRERGVVWTSETLNAYLADPEKMIPGTLMAAVRLDDAAERDDLIAYLKKAAE